MQERLSHQDNDNVPVRLTAKAAAHVRRQLAQDAKAIGLRVGVKRTGCSGWAYVVDRVYAAQTDDVVFNDASGIDIYVASQSLEMLRGLEVDLVRKGLTEQLQFNNPNSTSQCGCGESFAV